MNKRIVFLGYPGSGKGTQSELLNQEFGIFVLSTGDAFRHMIKDGVGETADIIRSYVNKGELVPDDLTFQVIQESLPDCNSGWILDGFPRNLNQAELLKDFCAPTDVILFHIEENIIFQRLSGRRIAKSSGKVYNIYLNPPKREGICDISGEVLIQREDDQPDTVAKRLEIYRIETEPLISYYKDAGLLKIVQANQPIEKVFENLKEVLQLV